VNRHRLGPTWRLPGVGAQEGRRNGTARSGRGLKPNSPRRSSTRAACAGGQGRDRTADLPLFRRSLIPTELPGQRERNQGVPGTRPPSMTTATQTGLEPATFAVTGRRANQLRHWALLRNVTNSSRHSTSASRAGFRAANQLVHPFRARTARRCSVRTPGRGGRARRGVYAEAMVLGQAVQDPSRSTAGALMHHSNLVECIPSSTQVTVPSGAVRTNEPTTITRPGFSSRG
jgi:hypothetical protein